MFTLCAYTHLLCVSLALCCMRVPYLFIYLFADRCPFTTFRSKSKEIQRKRTNSVFEISLYSLCVEIEPNWNNLQPYI